MRVVPDNDCGPHSELALASKPFLVTSSNAPITRVARGSVTAFAIYIVSVGLTYCSQLLIARIVGVDTYGIYSYVFAWMAVLAYFCALGFDVALLRFVPAYEAKQAWDLVNGVIRYSQRRAVIVGVLIVSLGIAITTLRRSSMSRELDNTFLVGFALVPILALLWIRCSVVRAFGGVVWAVAPDRLVRDGMLIALVAVSAIGLGWPMDAPRLMLATLVSSALGLALASLAMRRLRPRSADAAVPAYAAAIWRGVALPLVLIGATEALMNRTGVLLLGWLGDTKGAGVYSLVFNIAFVVALPRTAVNTLFAPTISSLFIRDDRIMLQALVARAAAWTLCAGALIALVLAVLAEPLLSWFGPGFEGGVPALRILLLGQVIVSSAGSQLYVMTMTGNERSAVTLLGASACANVVGCAVLVSLFGLTGVAISATATLILWNLAMAVFIWRRLHLLPGLLAMFRLRPEANGAAAQREGALHELANPLAPNGVGASALTDPVEEDTLEPPPMPLSGTEHCESEASAISGR
jgi:O-antigen/teichoic acid export membrane protein